MRNKRNIPNIRFKGFAEEWKEQQLGNCADIIGGGTPDTSNREYWDGDIDWYSPAEIGDKVFVDGSKRRITELGLKESSAKILPVGTVLFSSRAGIGSSAILAKKGATNQGFQSIIPHNNKLDTYFIFSRTRELKKYGETNGAGSTFIEVSGKQMESMPIINPEIDEQKAIGNYFQNIDRLINTSQTKLDKLKKIKKACLEKMFPRNGSTTPELRFKGFSEAWKEIKVKNLGNVITGNTPSKTEPTFWGGNFIWVTAQDLKNKYINDSILKLTIQGKEKARVIPRNSIIVTCIASIGLNGINNVECATNQQINSIVCDNEYYYEYIYYSFEHRANLLRGIAGQTAVPIINKSTFEDFSIISPKSKIEQERIGNIFKNLDDLIAKTEQQINKFKNIKKACLDKMFVNTEDKI